MTARPLPIVPTGKVRDERRMIQLINAHIGHWNTLDQEDVEGLPDNIEVIKEIGVRNFTVVEANGTPFDAGGLNAKFEDIAVPGVDVKSYIGLDAQNGDALAVEFFTEPTAPDVLRVSWFAELYSAAGLYNTNQTLHAITGVPTVVPINIALLEVNMTLAADAVTVDFANQYIVSVNVIWSSVGVNGEMQFRARVNGTPVGTGVNIQTDNQTTTQAFSFSAMFPMAVGDVLDFTVEGITGTFPSAEIEHLDITIESLVGDGRVWTSAEFRALIVTPE